MNTSIRPPTSYCFSRKSFFVARHSVGEGIDTMAAVAEDLTKTQWGHALKGLSWRLDVTTDRDQMGTFGEPVALLELNAGKREGEVEKSIKCQFAKGELGDLLNNLADIQAVIEKNLQVGDGDGKTA